MNKLVFGIIERYNQNDGWGVIKPDDSHFDSVSFYRINEGYAWVSSTEVSISKSRVQTERIVNTGDRVVFCFITSDESSKTVIVWIWEDDWARANAEMLLRSKRQEWQDDNERNKESRGFGSKTGPQDRQRKYGRGHNYWDDIWAGFNRLLNDDYFESYQPPPCMQPPSGIDWRRVLGISNDVKITAHLVKISFRRKARGCHPDTGGSHAAMIALFRAREIALTLVE